MSFLQMSLPLPYLYGHNSTKVELVKRAQIKQLPGVVAAAEVVDCEML